MSSPRTPKGRGALLREIVEAMPVDVSDWDANERADQFGGTWHDYEIDFEDEEIPFDKDFLEVVIAPFFEVLNPEYGYPRRLKAYLGFGVQREGAQKEGFARTHGVTYLNALESHAVAWATTLKGSTPYFAFTKLRLSVEWKEPTKRGRKKGTKEKRQRKAKHSGRRGTRHRDGKVGSARNRGSATKRKRKK